MAKYDLYPAPGGVGYVLDVQAELLDTLNTRVVVPLLPRSEAPIPARRLNPVFPLPDGEHVMVTQFLSAVPRGILGAPVGTLKDSFAEITAALDMVFQGF
ncbi:CcdB family protein [Oceaniglobus roseus]|uniref:CcdB family protein n=1 Tax=Oceaniglobus roseus TaxID=1737570 RepID=UPI000C7F5CE0|nr:CcdB family protein [Kandeliimicrobium roseum]